MSDFNQLNEELMKSIRVAAINGVLTNEAADQVKEVMDDNKRLKNRIKKLEEELHESVSSCIAYKAEISKLEEKECSIKGREQIVRVKENDIIRMECELSGAKERVRDHKEMFGLVFRNIEIRRNVMTGVHGNAQTYGFVDERKQTEEVI